MQKEGTDILLAKTIPSFFPVPKPISSGGEFAVPTLPSGPFSIHPTYVTLGLQGQTITNGLIGSLRNFQMFNVVLTEE